MEYSRPAGSTEKRFESVNPPLDLKQNGLSSNRTPAVPSYLREVYHWAYLSQRNARLLDHEWVVKTILWRQHRCLEQAAFAEIEAGQKVLQAACVYGGFSAALALHVGPCGILKVVDVSEVQVTRCRSKLERFDHASVERQDVLYLRNEQADVVCCYFLLHEMPDDYKSGVVTALLNNVRPGGKVVFVDYHKPHWAHPLRLLTSLIFGTLEPFAKSLWRREISSFSDPDDRFTWRKQTYFGGLYQKVVAQRNHSA